MGDNPAPAATGREIEAALRLAIDALREKAGRGNEIAMTRAQRWRASELREAADTLKAAQPVLARAPELAEALLPFAAAFRRYGSPVGIRHLPPTADWRRAADVLAALPREGEGG